MPDSGVFAVGSMTSRIVGMVGLWVISKTDRKFRSVSRCGWPESVCTFWSRWIVCSSLRFPSRASGTSLRAALPARSLSLCSCLSHNVRHLYLVSLVNSDISSLLTNLYLMKSRRTFERKPQIINEFSGRPLVLLWPKCNAVDLCAEWSGPILRSVWTEQIGCAACNIILET